MTFSAPLEIRYGSFTRTREMSQEKKYPHFGVAHVR